MSPIISKIWVAVAADVPWRSLPLRPAFGIVS
jgi:hypothetical protein